VPFIGDPRAGFEVRSEHADGIEVLALRGELGIGSVPQLQPALEEAIDRGAPLVIDLSEVSFLDSQGLYALLVLRNRLRKSRRPLAVVCAEGGDVPIVFEVSGTRELFEIFPTRTAAVAAVRGG
jgi:anti-sigma B factor antagonist